MHLLVKNAVKVNNGWTVDMGCNKILIDCYYDLRFYGFTCSLREYAHDPSYKQLARLDCTLKTVLTLKRFDDISIKANIIGNGDTLEQVVENRKAKLRLLDLKVNSMPIDI